MTLRIEERPDEAGVFAQKVTFIDHRRSTSSIATSSADVLRRSDSILEDGWVWRAEVVPRFPDDTVAEKKLRLDRRYDQ
ncbi:hypothetical protein KDW20_31515 [Burkholderia cenocepacia]|uniref:hypothetical protein n=1 Tax=Burkholderia cenocepacia TaxID=95486 RepID=UPI001BA08815|nr:hypothetical protein [Burkholderia cenocepacia]MBR8380310.1 hypothetical protein [Burkholderia cenocepacia]MBR8415035.1 hypothetical protein [Burkholderia cenocepacia]